MKDAIGQELKVDDKILHIRSYRGKVRITKATTVDFGKNETRVGYRTIYNTFDDSRCSYTTPSRVIKFEWEEEDES